MCESKFSLVDLSALSEPACKLIEAVSQCIGTLYEPTRIRRKAKANADAALILAEADAGRQALLKRAAHRLAIQEVRRQNNIENIISQAIKSLPENVSSEPVDPDWISRLFDECKDVSNEDLQEIWGKLLAGEIAMPKSCSRKTLTVLKDLAPNDAAIFNKLCSLIWESGGHFLPYNIKLIIDSQLEKYGISYDECLHLETLGLINFKKDISIHVRPGEIIKYFKFNHNIYLNNNRIIGNIACFPLTKSGIELFMVANAEPYIKFYDDCLKLFSDKYEIYLVSPIK